MHVLWLYLNCKISSLKSYFVFEQKMANLDHYRQWWVHERHLEIDLMYNLHFWVHFIANDKMHGIEEHCYKHDAKIVFYKMMLKCSRWSKYLQSYFSVCMSALRRQGSHTCPSLAWTRQLYYWSECASVCFFLSSCILVYSWLRVSLRDIQL